ncbi:hypothetical protein TMatcc_004923 [Talaromyces marneffei ATCC 18224]|uniref:Benzodiazepine receptor family protein n=2 Tax=Talaromyces marneffei TaxID=37727 RepID=B6Q1C3_TALMQ|nr:uncharacterized protein EYB26_000159 [Talaromyces marneffei]EEA26786.1 benzodiazepine receptor family protein [Talaromyces marneffei ATCC 18224]KAE8557469.1 hypothetical protein EYB25_002176 [Talaromyces marneffei]QGA12515.1 hypothetical protein EYB26_000159 [Talaromyces marneffei]
MTSLWNYFSLPTAVFTSPVAAILMPVTAGALVGYTTTSVSNTQSIYKAIRQPPLYPPGCVFGPVWTMLYGAMGYASYRATVSGLSSPSSVIRELAHTSQTLYTIQLAANLIWMPLFFGMRKPLAALMDILAVGGSVLALANNYRKIDNVSFWLLVPYLGWLGFATYLNFGAGYLNGWDISDEKIGRSKTK